MRWMNLETIIQSEVSQKKKDKYSILMHRYRIYKNGINLDAHQQTNGQGSCGTYTPWNITQPLKRIHLNQF